MTSNAKRAVACALAVTMVAVATGCGGAVGESAGKSSDKAAVKVGVLGVLGGQFAVYGPSIINSSKLAVKQLNDKGGVLGRKVELDLGDTQGDPKQAGVLARRLVDRDKVSVLVGSVSSPEREAAMTTVRRSGIPLMYAADYEGGACDKQLFNMGSVPPTLAPAVTYLVQSLKREKWYFIGSDYGYPKTMNDDMAKVVEAAGGKVVGKSLVPLGTNDLSQEIEKISKSGADTVFTTVVAADGVALVKQGGSFGLWKKARIVTPTIWDDQVPALEPAIKGAYATLAWTPTLSEPSTTKFMTDYRAAYGQDVGALSQLGENTYNAIMAWAQAAEKAKSLDFGKVISALGGLTYEDAPRGPITIEANTHHVKMPVYLAEAGGDGKYKVVKSFPPTAPGAQCSF
jgi:ABC-type branched-subunit amino acid transport system substrate-binding protein